MKFMNKKREAQPQDESAFAERLSAITVRSRGDVAEFPPCEVLADVPAIERRFWNPADLPDGADEAGAAYGR